MKELMQWTNEEKEFIQETFNNFQNNWGMGWLKLEF